MIALLLVFTFFSFSSHAGASARCSSGDKQSVTSISASCESVTHTHPPASKQHVTEWQGKTLLQVRSKASKAIVWEEDDEDEHEYILLQKQMHESRAAPAATPAANKLDSANAKVPVAEESAATASGKRGKLWDDLENVIKSQEHTKPVPAKLDPLSMLSSKYDIDKDPAKKAQDVTEEKVAEAREFNLRPAETLWPDKP